MWLFVKFFRIFFTLFCQFDVMISSSRLTKSVTHTEQFLYDVYLKIKYILKIILLDGKQNLLEVNIFLRVEDSFQIPSLKVILLNLPFTGLN